MQRSRTAHVASADECLSTFPKRALVAAAGTVRQGGIVLGLLDIGDQWTVTTAIGEGPFRTGIEVPVDGEYLD